MKNTLDELLKENMSVNRPDFDYPKLSEAARQKIILRKKPKHEKPDLILWLATFINLKMKLVHAVLALVILNMSLLFITAPVSNSNSGGVPGELCDMPSVQSSTTLPVINTYRMN